jgi:mRNA-degrading endonuclease toxin of MazEF toxin-antitoxin module
VPIDPKPGEVWFAELCMVEKSRPDLVLAFPDSKDVRSLAIVAPLTSQIRDMRGEVDLGKPR